ncbi:MAG TPA: PAS domain-containing protein [Caulobacteraceae bacterium]|jgi:PAS domain S-box-containing protein|nr:PAS domain-containing protein [Caulobacteraceae bacterium]
MAEIPLRETVTTQNVAERLQRFRELFEYSPIFAAVGLGREHVIVAINPAFQRLIGDRAVMGKPARQALADIQDTGIFDLLDEVFAGGETRSVRGVPVAFPGAEGKSRSYHLDVVFQPVRDQEGQVAAIFVQGIDATQAHAANEALRLSEARFRAAVGAVQGVVWTNSAAGEMTGEQPGWASLTGQAQEEYRGYGWLAAVHPEDARPTMDAWREAVAEQRTFVFEHRVLCRDGGYRPFSVRAAPTFDDDGALLEWVGVHTDITEQREAEQSLRELNETLEQRIIARTAQLKASEARLRTIFETGFQHQGLLTPQGVMLEANSISLQGIRAKVEDVVGRPYWELPWFSDTPGMPETIKAAVATAASGEAVRREVHLNLPEGGWRWFDFSLRPMRDVDGAVIALVPEAVEMTQRRQAEEALRQAQKMEAVGQLTGGIAHDFNNLLAGISGSLELLDRRIRQGRLEAAPRYVEAAQGAVKRAAALTQRLLAFSRRQTLNPKPINVNRLVSGLEELIRRTVGPEIELEVVGAGGLWSTLVDPHQLENALLNLCINARDAMPGGGRLTVETANKWLDERSAANRELAPGQYVSICVTDTGAGMTPEVMARAFDPFFTTKPLGVGTGLGLSMIYGFARQSGGQVRVYSEVGRGTTMCLYLPRHYGKAEETLTPASASGARQVGHGETVLVVDDEETIRGLVAEVLEELGYSAIEAADGPSGVSVLESDSRIDLMITDVGLPGGMNGRQVADAGRSLRPGLKVLFITGYAENAVVGNGHLDPGMQLLTKPFEIDALSDKIREMIEG